jgi:uncharacterized protein YjbI with pentapeptide repeats
MMQRPAIRSERDDGAQLDLMVTAPAESRAGSGGMSDIETVFECLLVAVQEQVTALEACIHDPARSRALGACLRHTIARLDRVAVLIVVRGAPDRKATPRRSIMAKLDALHGRARPLLACVRHGAEIEARRFATRLSALDPLASVRFGPEGIVDASGKVITGVPLRAALQYRAEDGRPIMNAKALLADVTLRDADLRRALLSRARLLDLDARGVILDGAIGIEARLMRVNLAGASMQGANLRAVIARDCDFSGADLADTKWHGATALRCSFSEAVLADLSADGAVFLDCDFRGADLTVGDRNVRAMMAGARFLRCDLRRSRWCNRTLAGVRFIRCKLHGVRGPAHLDGVIVDQPDLSKGGDGSWVGSLEDVLSLWANASSIGGSMATARHEEAS